MEEAGGVGAETQRVQARSRAGFVGVGRSKMYEDKRLRGETEEENRRLR